MSLEEQSLQKINTARYLLTLRHHSSTIICLPVPADTDMTRCLLMITLHRCNKCCFVWWCSSCRCWPSPHASSTLSSHATTMQSCTLMLQPAASSLTSTSPSSPCSWSPSLVRCVHVQRLLCSQCCNLESCYTVLLRSTPLTLQKVLQSSVHGISGISNMHYYEVGPRAQHCLATHQSRQHVTIPQTCHASA